MAKESSLIQRVRFTQENGEMTRLTVKVPTLIQTAPNMKVNGTKTCSMD